MAPTPDKRKEKFGTSVSNLETGVPIWIGYGRGSETLESWVRVLDDLVTSDTLDDRDTRTFIAYYSGVTKMAWRVIDAGTTVH